MFGIENMKNEKQLGDESILFIKQNKHLLYDRFANDEFFTPRAEPITVFMAGIPGAGKTEVARHIIAQMRTKPVHIDADEIRELFRGAGYNGTNAHIFQRASSHGVDKLFDYVQQKRFHAIVDGTFAHNRVIENVERSLGRKRKVIIYFISQDPIIAWKITKGRERDVGRRVPKKAFIDAYFKSHENIKYIKEKFGDNIELNLIVKNAQTGLQKQYNNIDDIDPYIDMRYSRSTLEEKLC